MRNLRLFFQSNELAQVVFTDSSHADQLVHYKAFSNATHVNQNFYNEFYSADNNPLKVTRQIQFSSLLNVLKSHLKTPGKKTLLDIGCGQGDFIRLVQKENSFKIDAYGIEPAISQETQNIKKITLQGVQNNPDIPHNYDIITLFDVFEHFPDPHESMKTLLSLLKADGRLVLMVPNKDSLLYRLGKLLVPLFPKITGPFFARLYQVNYPPPHYFYYNATSLKSLLKPFFEVEYVGYQSQLPLRGIPTRFWGVSKKLKPFFMISAVFYRLFSPFSLNDSLVIIAKKNHTPSVNRQATT